MAHTNVPLKIPGRLSHHAIITAACPSPSIIKYNPHMQTRDEALRAIKNLSDEEFSRKIEHENFSVERKKILFSFIKGEIPSTYPHNIDIECFAIKILLPEIYETLPKLEHLYSNCENYEYDPAKSGQNMIKHGIGFGEVISYSKRFGALMVPVPDKEDGERWVNFSSVDSGINGKKLLIPPARKGGLIYVLSIMQQKGTKFRFISSEVMSSKRKRVDRLIKNAFKHNFPSSQEKQEYVDYCIDLLKRDLFEYGSLIE